MVINDNDVTEDAVQIDNHLFSLKRYRYISISIISKYEKKDGKKILNIFHENDVIMDGAAL